MKKRTPKHGSIAYYIEEVVKYRAEDETGQHVKETNNQENGGSICQRSI